ncbi:MAG TPA: hypothetical protein ENH62_01130 [Marinobacter sp.]|uniref:Uncharacterized protein n=1 Tax=marine sediment metagenome TaxID=412755 RepID=A0A0F9Q4Y7_9ZZZZ|nr:hypothetical protein [Marinobacter sp.]
MAFQDFLLRARRPVSLVAFNGALPSNFKLIHKPESTWIELPGVNIDPVASLELAPGTLSSDIHYNLRVTDAWSGFAGLFITDPADPDFNDPVLNKSKLKRWFKNNGVERLDTAAEHPRSGRADMRGFRWTDGTEWLDIFIDEPVFRRRVWL